MEEEGFTGLDMWITSACHWFHSTMEDESTKEKLEKHNEEQKMRLTCQEAAAATLDKLQSWPKTRPFLKDCNSHI